MSVESLWFDHHGAGIEGDGEIAGFGGAEIAGNLAVE